MKPKVRSALVLIMSTCTARPRPRRAPRPPGCRCAGAARDAPRRFPTTRAAADTARHVIHRTLNTHLLSQMARAPYDAVYNIARHVIQRTLNPRLLSHMAPYDVEYSINIRQTIPPTRASPAAWRPPRGYPPGTPPPSD